MPSKAYVPPGKLGIEAHLRRDPIGMVGKSAQKETLVF